MKILVIDGQGGRMGKSIIEQLKKSCQEPYPFELYGIGTNSNATLAMMKAGAGLRRVPGEKPGVVKFPGDADMIIGPVGIVIANSLLGEITPAIATAIGASPAYKILIPINRCNHMIVGCKEAPLSEYLQQVCQIVLREIRA